DVGVGALRDDANGPDSGSVSVFSGMDGSLLWILPGARAGDLASAVGPAGDIDHDGFADVIVGAAFQEPGYARVFSARTGQPILTLLGGPTSHDFGVDVSGGADVNGDGTSDLLVADSGDDENAFGGAAWVFSGVDGSVIYRVPGQELDLISTI